MLLIIYLFSVIYSTLAQGNYQITTLEHNPGIYYENLHNLRFAKAFWRITTFIDVDKIYHETPLVAQQFYTLNTSCPNKFIYCEDKIGKLKYILDKNNQAENLYQQILSETIDFEHKHLKPMSYPAPIIKRSMPFGFIGSLSKSLFGTLSEDDSAYYDDQIDKLFEDQKSLAHLVQQQTYFVHSKLEQTDKHLFELRDNQKQLFALAKYLGEKMTEDDNIIKVLEYTQNITEWINAAIATIELHSETYRTILDIIRDARRGKLHSGLLNRTQLQQISQHIHDINPGYEFPIPKDFVRAERLSEVATVNLGRRGSRFIIEIRIPLLDTLSYDLYKMHPLPIPQALTNKTAGSAYIIPRTTYLAIGTDRVKHMFLSEEHLHKCKNTVYHYICNYEGPLYEETTCEKATLLDPSIKSLKTCDIRYAPVHSAFWKRIDSVDGWLYSLAGQGALQVYCPGERAELVDIRNIGIVQFRPRCYGRYGTTTLNGIHAVATSENFFYLPKVSLKVSDIAPIFANAHIEPELLPAFKENTPAARDWSSINDADSLLDLEKEVQIIIERKRSQHHTQSLINIGFGFQVTSIFLLCVIGALFAFRYIRSHKQLKTQIRRMFDQEEANKEELSDLNLNQDTAQESA